MDVIYNERIKLFATFLNGLGVAIFAVGGLAPMVSALYGPTSFTLFLAAMIAICIIGAFTLHFTASRFLKRMKQ